MIPQGYPLTVQDTGGRWWYVIGWDAQGGPGIEPWVVPMAYTPGDTAPRLLNDVYVRTWDASPPPVTLATEG